jgi:hypothetical protein
MQTHPQRPKLDELNEVIAAKKGSISNKISLFPFPFLLSV